MCEVNFLTVLKLDSQELCWSEYFTGPLSGYLKNAFLFNEDVILVTTDCLCVSCCSCNGEYYEKDIDVADACYCFGIANRILTPLHLKVPCGDKYETAVVSADILI